MMRRLTEKRLQIWQRKSATGEHIDCMITVYAEAKELLRELQGYEVSAARYLAKPVDENRLREAVLYCYGQYQKGRDLLLPINGGTRKVASKDIYNIEIIGRKCRIRQAKDEWDTRVSMEELEKMLKGKSA